MKKIFPGVLTLVYLLVLTGISACSASEPESDKSEYELSGFRIEKDSLFILSENEKCYVKIYYPVIIPEMPDKIIDSINLFLKTEFTSLPEFYDMDNCKPDLHFTYEASFEVKYSGKKYLSILFSFYEYSGGTHGNSASAGYNFDLETGKRLMLDDVITDNAFTKLSSLAVESLLRKFNTSRLTEAGLYEDMLNITQSQDYYLTEYGITIQFDPYEIAPYYLGEIEALINGPELLKIIRPEFKYIFEGN